MATLPQAKNGDYQNLSPYNQRALAKDPSLAPRFGVKNVGLSVANTDAAALYKPQINSTNLYYDTLAKKMGEMQTQNLGVLKSGWAGSETLPSSGFYQQQRSDVVKQSSDTGIQNERARAADLASIATQTTNAAKAAYTQETTLPQVQQKSEIAQTASDISQTQSKTSTGLSLGTLVSSLSTLPSVPDDAILRAIYKYFNM